MIANTKWEVTGRTAISLRFWAKVHKTKGCWEWRGAKFAQGYGKLSVNGRLQKTHRVSWKLKHGDITSAMCVCHKCDNKLCVRPGHLFLGTHAENMADMKRKGRRKGIGACAANGRAKLTAKDVKEIRKSTENHSAAGRRYGVSHSTIRQIRLGKSWKEIICHCKSQTPAED